MPSELKVTSAHLSFTRSSHRIILANATRHTAISLTSVKDGADPEPPPWPSTCQPSLGLANMHRNPSKVDVTKGDAPNGWSPASPCNHERACTASSTAALDSVDSLMRCCMYSTRWSSCTGKLGTLCLASAQIFHHWNAPRYFLVVLLYLPCFSVLLLACRDWAVSSTLGPLGFPVVAMLLWEHTWVGEHGEKIDKRCTTPPTAQVGLPKSTTGIQPPG